MSNPATFKAKRTYSCRELTALRRERVDRTQTRPPSINLQDSSEATARARKLASILPETLPSYGNSTNMVKWRDCSVVQAMRAGSVYRAAALSREPRLDDCTISRVPNPFLDLTTTNVAGQTRPFTVFTQPKAITCVQPEVGEVRVPQPFNKAEHFGMRKNDNKVVMTNAPAFPPGKCQSCDRL
jgi:hypothetical protein